MTFATVTIPVAMFVSLGSVLLFLGYLLLLAMQPEPEAQPVPIRVTADEPDPRRYGGSGGSGGC